MLHIRLIRRWNVGVHLGLRHNRPGRVTRFKTTWSGDLYCTLPATVPMLYLIDIWSSIGGRQWQHQHYAGGG